MLEAAGEFLDGQLDETAEWDLQLRAVRSWIQVLRGEDPCDAVMECLEAARRSGFRLLLRTALAHGAMCLVLQDRRDEASALLSELEESWREDPAWPSREWLPAAAHAAALLDARHTAAMRELLESLEHRTLWARAAIHVLDGATAAYRGDHTAAARHYAQAVAVYDVMGNATDAALAAVWTLRALVASGDLEDSGTWQERVQEFARRNGARRLLEGLPSVEGETTITLDAAPAPGQSASRPASIA
jgi:hypothetical protein